MPTIMLNKNVFEKLVGKKLPLDKLKDRISMLGTDLEGIEGNTIEVEVFPNRPDMLSEQGFARAFSSFIGVKCGLLKYDVCDSGESVVVDKSVKDVRPYTACAIVKGLKFDDEMIREVIQIQEKLHVTYGRNRKKVAIGIYPYDKIKSPISFKGVPVKDVRFRPLGSDVEMSGKDILLKHPTGKEYGHLLNGMSKYPIFSDSTGKVLSMPPIINSHDLGMVTEKTRDVFIECSGYDFRILKICLNIVVSALADMGGKIYSMKLKYPDKTYVTPDLAPSRMKVDRKYISKLLGIDLSEKDMEMYLGRMGFGYSKGQVLVPAYRADILHQVDFAEDIAIAYGYENVEAKIPKVATIAKESSLSIFKRRLGNYLAGVGFIECKSYHLSSDDVQHKKMGLKKGKLVRLSNSLTEDYDALRNALLPGLIKILSENKHNEFPQNLFEIGKVFRFDDSEDTGVREDLQLAVASADVNTEYSVMKSLFDQLNSVFGFGLSLKDKDCMCFVSGRSAQIFKGKELVGGIGEVRPQVLNNWELDVPVSAIVIDLHRLL